MEQRRHFIKNMGFIATAALTSSSVFAIPVNEQSSKKLRFGLISDLHHLQFGQDEIPRLKSFMDEVVKTKPDFIIQCGDFCRAQKSDGIMAEWNRFDGAKYHVLGNHDMDLCSKETIMKFWNMPKRYYSFDQDGYHFVIMDRNFLKKDDGTLVDYNTSNWGPLPAPKRSFTDSGQLDWLKQDLAAAKFPVIVFMHQPVFLTDYSDEIGNADEILKIFDQVNFSAKEQGNIARVTAVFMGHDHDDRYGERNGVHYFIVNSASYVYQGHAHFYNESLFAFVKLDPKGKMTIEGRSTTYKKGTPEDIQITFPSKISNRDLKL